MFGAMTRATHVLQKMGMFINTGTRCQKSSKGRYYKAKTSTIKTEIVMITARRILSFGFPINHQANVHAI
jgi:hypothetical protein